MPDRVLHTKLDGPGLFLFEVAGQNHYQPAILQLLQGRFQESAALESTAQSAEDYVTAILRSEPSNPHDGNAIAVEISGLKVGYLDRHTAAKLTNQCKRLGFDRIEATCKAKLSGYRSHDDQAAKVNVVLDYYTRQETGDRPRVGERLSGSNQSPNAVSWGAWLNPSPLATGSTKSPGYI
jgi:hypothetical protein